MRHVRGCWQVKSPVHEPFVVDVRVTRHLSYLLLKFLPILCAIDVLHYHEKGNVLATSISGGTTYLHACRTSRIEAASKARLAAGLPALRPDGTPYVRGPYKPRAPKNASAAGNGTDERRKPGKTPQQPDQTVLQQLGMSHLK